MAASAARAAMALRASSSRPVAFVRKNPLDRLFNNMFCEILILPPGLTNYRAHKKFSLCGLLKGELREHFAQFGHIRKCTVPFDKETGFHRGMGWIHFSSEEELQNVLQHDNHVIDGVKLHVQAQRPKVLQGDQTSDDEKDF